MKSNIFYYFLYCFLHSTFIYCLLLFLDSYYALDKGRYNKYGCCVNVRTQDKEKLETITILSGNRNYKDSTGSGTQKIK